MWAGIAIVGALVAPIANDLWASFRPVLTSTDWRAVATALKEPSLQATLLSGLAVFASVIRYRLTTRGRRTRWSTGTIEIALMALLLGNLLVFGTYLSTGDPQS